MFCEKCGNPVTASLNYCPKCGNKIQACQEAVDSKQPFVKSKSIASIPIRPTLLVSAVVFLAIVIWIVSPSATSNLQNYSTPKLFKKFDAFVEAGNDYEAALAMKELCKRGAYSNIEEQGILGLNCKLIESASSNDVSFDRGGGSGPVDLKGMAFLKNGR